MHGDRDTPSYLGLTNHRRRFQRFGIKQADRLSHIYIVGQTGVGKSTLLEQLARQDTAGDRGLAVIDPHGDLADQLYASLTPAERERAVYFNAADPSQPYGYNPLRRVRTDKIPLAASGLIEAFKKIWPDAWGVRMEHVLRNSLYLRRRGAEGGVGGTTPAPRRAGGVATRFIAVAIPPHPLSQWLAAMRTVHEEA